MRDGNAMDNHENLISRLRQRAGLPLRSPVSCPSFPCLSFSPALGGPLNAMDAPPVSGNYALNAGFGFTLIGEAQVRL
jgi:hypothetical protein